MSDQPATIRLTDYTPPAFDASTVHLDIDFQNDHALVTSRVNYHRTEAASPGALLQLDGENMTLVHVAIDGIDLAPENYAETKSGLTITTSAVNFCCEITTRVEPDNNKALEGIYRSGPCYCTQMEAQGFRRMTYFPDRPDILSVYTTRLEADFESCPQLLANGNLVESGSLPADRHFALWHDPHPKPSYLFALVAGDLALVEDTFTTMNGREVALKFYVEHANEDRCSHAIRSLQASMKWDEETWGREYDLDIYMVVAVNDFNAGAMENKGLNIFNSALVLARPDTATDGDFESIEGVIGHEYFHNWSGNRVTLRDWFQLSLKEGLTVFRDQEFSSDMNSRGVKRINDVRGLRAFQFPEDAGPMAHPIRPPEYIEIDNFYTTTVYEKGAEVIRMMQTIVGKEAFRQAVEVYFEKYDGCAVTTDDFIATIEESTGADLGVFSRWYAQAGTPQLNVTWIHDSESATLAFHFEQTCRATRETTDKLPFQIPVKVALIGADGLEVRSSLKGSGTQEIEHVFQVTEATQDFILEGVDKSATPSILRGFSAPVRLTTAHTEDELLFLLASDNDAFNRWEAGQTLATRHILKGVDTHGANEDNARLVAAFGAVLNDYAADPAFTAEALILPPENSLAEEMEIIDVEGIHRERRSLLRAITQAHRSTFERVHRELRDTPGDAVDAATMGRRRLANVCLAYLASIEEPETTSMVMEQFETARNMTESFSALSILTDIDCAERTTALESFREQWADDFLVMNKWFGVQSMSRLRGGADRVRALTADPKFDDSNPNRVRALYGSFSRNAINFHDVSGDGYVLLAEALIELDSKNPMVAGRMVSAFNLWRRHTPGRQLLMKAQMERILATEGLSKNVFEVVSRALA